MGLHKLVICEFCKKEMRSDNLKRHLSVMHKDAENKALIHDSNDELEEIEEMAMRRLLELEDNSYTTRETVPRNEDEIKHEERNKREKRSRTPPPDYDSDDEIKHEEKIEKKKYKTRTPPPKEDAIDSDNSLNDDKYKPEIAKDRILMKFFKSDDIELLKKFNNGTIRKIYKHCKNVVTGKYPISAKQKSALKCYQYILLDLIEKRYPLSKRRDIVVKYGGNFLKPLLNTVMK